MNFHNFGPDLTKFQLKASLRCRQYESNIQLSNMIPQDLYLRLQDYFSSTERMGQNSIQWQNLKPYALFEEIGTFPGYIPSEQITPQKKSELIKISDCHEVQCTDNSDFELDMDIDDSSMYMLMSLDSYLRTLAQFHFDKKIGGVETIEEKCSKYDNFPLRLAVFALNETLNTFDTVKNASQYKRFYIEELNKYRCGHDISELSYTECIIRRDVYKSMEQISEENPNQKELLEYYKRRLISRNRAMTDRVASLIKSSPKSKLFFAFGAAHFFGENSIVQLLKEEGHTVERVKKFEKLWYKI